MKGTALLIGIVVVVGLVLGELLYHFMGIKIFWWHALGLPW